MKEWRPERAGMSIIYEYEDGRRVIADGHQRLGLAKRLASEGKPVQMPAMIIRQRDGISPQEARTIAAMKNIAEGSGTAVDAAKVLRDSDSTPEQMGLPPSSALVRDAAGLRNLSADAFGMVVNGVASERDGGIVGRVVQDPAAQANILGLLNRLKPSNAFQAESIARQAAADTVTETQDSLFGPEADTQNLYLERAKILDAASKRVREDLKTFRTLVDRAETVQGAGNVLNADENERRLASDAAVRDYLSSEANTKGPISDALTAAARAFKGGAKPGQVVADFLATVERELGSRRGDSETGGGARPSDGSGRRESVEPQAVEVGQDADAASADLFAPEQTGKTPDQQRAEAEAEVKANQSKIRTSAPQVDAGPLFDTQGDLLDAPNQKFNHLKRMQLLEAIKARAAVGDIKKHLALGRKVVVFHDYNVGGGFNPFSGVVPADDANAISAMADLMAKHPDLQKLDFAGYGAPADTLSTAFGDKARLFNGTVPKAKRLKNLADFNADGSGADVLIVQADAGGAGISMHDTTGAHQRVLINLGMPNKPTTTLQQEGRILRVGSVSNAPFRYFTIGTAWERRAFAQKIAERSGAVENLALGNEARAITDGFINAYIEAEAFDPSPADGIGGKERDRRTQTTSPFQIALSHYFGRMKVTGRRDHRDGLDFYPTAEPLAFKMVEWAGIRPNERVLEPSAGDGAIARYMPEGIDLTMVEPSMDLASRAQLRAPAGKVVETTFENFHLVNKAHVIVMNPPFGQGGATAIAHLAKAARHLRPGGRIVALIPSGPSADKRFDTWFHGDDAKGLHLTAEVALPAVAFERAGTKVMTRVVVIDKPASPDQLPPEGKRINFTGRAPSRTSSSGWKATTCPAARKRPSMR
ncbi:hypothetical protein MASR1M32_39620 [Rhodobacter sp.]